jgi:hypothetical protein
MAMICPVCSQQFEQRVQCPSCRINLVPRVARRPDPEALAPHWSRSPWVRVALGVLLAQGLFYGVQHLLLAGFLAVGDEAGASHWRKLSGLLAIQGLQIATLLVGSILAGASQPSGGMYGAMVGVWNGILWVIIQNMQGGPVSAVVLYSQPVLHTAFGAFGGLVGAAIWRPITPVSTRAAVQSLTVKPQPQRILSLKSARIHWLRVGAGVAIAIGGVLWADTILELVLRASEGRMTVRTTLQEKLMTLEITGLAIFIGAGLAGANTWNGLLQGACVGVVSAAVLVGYWFGYRMTVSRPEEAALMIAGIVALSILGGLFGGRLLPPVLPYQRQRVAPV